MGVISELKNCNIFEFYIFEFHSSFLSQVPPGELPDNKEDNHFC